MIDVQLGAAHSVALRSRHDTLDGLQLSRDNMSIRPVVDGDGDAALDAQLLDVLRDAILRGLQSGHSSWAGRVGPEELGSLDDELQAGFQSECARND